MNKALLYIAGIFTAGCTFMSVNRGDNYYAADKNTCSIVQKDGTVVEYGHIRNRLPKNVTRVYKPGTYAFVQKSALKI